MPERIVTNPDKNGFYGQFGGAYVPELLYPNIHELQKHYLKIISSGSFKKELNKLLKNYVGRPTPLYFASKLSKFYDAKVYLKREDLCHTGAHKINNTLGQILLAKKLKKRRIIAETGAGQHGVATATACALMGLQCVIYMGEKDVARQAPNVARMKMLGATVVPVASGSKTLKDATNEAIRDWINNPVDTFYIIGSVVGPHPYPDLVARLQSVIGMEIKQQLAKENSNSPLPDYLIACVGGGSNAIGAFYPFIKEKKVHLIGAEAAGLGVNSAKTAASLSVGTKGILHGSMSYLMQNRDGQITEPHSISAGLDYPGIGPIHAYLHEIKRVKYLPITDKQAIKAGLRLTKLEGIIPALESAHALAVLDKMKLKKKDVVVVNLSGRGDKDLENYQNHI